MPPSLLLRRAWRGAEKRTSTRRPIDADDITRPPGHMPVSRIPYPGGEPASAARDQLKLTGNTHSASTEPSRPAARKVLGYFPGYLAHAGAQAIQSAIPWVNSLGLSLSASSSPGTRCPVRPS